MASSWVWVTIGIILIIIGIILFIAGIWQHSQNTVGGWTGGQIALIVFGIIFFIIGIIVALVPMFYTPKMVKIMPQSNIVVTKAPRVIELNQ
jgi:hypothetical protein